MRFTGYQPQWVDGREVGIGQRDCDGRYKAIAKQLRERSMREFSVLDLGAYNGYFCRRLVDDFDARATAVDDHSGLAPYPGVTVIPRRLDLIGIRELGRFDVTLGLSVLHHHCDWDGMLAALCDSAALVFIESVGLTERSGGLAARATHGQLDRIGTVIAWTPAARVHDALRPLWMIDTSRW